MVCSSRRSPRFPTLTENANGKRIQIGRTLADLALAATLFTLSDAHVDRDGNDKPMHTVALDANRLCKHRPSVAHVCGRSRCSSRLRLVPAKLTS